MTLTEDEIQHAADGLYHAERTATQIEPVSLRHPDMTMDDAYAIQSAWIQRKLDQGRAIVGYKIGLTSRTMQRAMKIDTPDYGVLLDDMVYADRADIDTATFTDPQIEVELAFVLKERLFGEAITVEQVVAATDYVVPALELIAARSYRVHPNTGYTRSVMDTISDNAASAGIVMGEKTISADAMDLRWCGAILKLNDVVEQTGLAAAVLDHPARGVCWVAKRFAPHGIALEPGQIILAGSFTAPVKVRRGDSVIADYGSLGQISVQFV